MYLQFINLISGEVHEYPWVDTIHTHIDVLFCRAHSALSCIRTTFDCIRSLFNCMRPGMNEIKKRPKTVSRKIESAHVRVNNLHAHRRHSCKKYTIHTTAFTWHHWKFALKHMCIYNLYTLCYSSLRCCSLYFIADVDRTLLCLVDGVTSSAIIGNMFFYSAYKIYCAQIRNRHSWVKQHGRHITQACQRWKR